MVFRPAAFRRRGRHHLLSHFVSWAPDTLFYEDVGDERRNQRRRRRAGIKERIRAREKLGDTEEEVLDQPDSPTASASTSPVATPRQEPASSVPPAETTHQPTPSPHHVQKKMKLEDNKPTVSEMLQT
ncbi:unnamed protein product [Ectocarpus sp. 8 AP-2014]